jgi:hypothetical protein
MGPVVAPDRKKGKTAADRSEIVEGRDVRTLLVRSRR